MSPSENNSCFRYLLTRCVFILFHCGKDSQANIARTLNLKAGVTWKENCPLAGVIFPLSFLSDICIW